MNDETLADWAQAGAFEKLAQLNLGWNQITDRGARILAHSPTLNRLETLVLDSNHIGVPGALDIASSKHLNNLTQLYMQDNNYSRIGEIALRVMRSRILVEKKRTENILNLNEQRLDNKDISSLAQYEKLDRVVSLSLRNNHFDYFGVQDLVNSKFLKNLTSLNLMSNAVGDKGLLLLAESPNLSKLESLNLENTGITALGVLALSRSSHLNQLRELNLCGNDLREKYKTITISENQCSQPPILQEAYKPSVYRFLGVWGERVRP